MGERIFVPARYEYGDGSLRVSTSVWVRGGGDGIILLLDVDWSFVSLEGSNNFQTLAY